MVRKAIVVLIVLACAAACTGFGYVWGHRSANLELIDWAYNLGYSSGVSDATTPGATVIDVSTGKTYTVPSNEK